MIQLDCDDSYRGLPSKVQEIMKWALAHNYDFTLKCDDDVVLDPVKYLNSGYEKYDFVGKANRTPTSANPFWVPMGFNYTLSQRGMALVTASELPSRYEGDNDDERWVSECLHKAGIALHDDNRYRLHYGYSAHSMARALRAPQEPNVPHRQLRPPAQQDDELASTFSRCIFMEGNSGNTIPAVVKLAEFRHVFDLCAKSAQSLSKARVKTC